MVGEYGQGVSSIPVVLPGLVKYTLSVAKDIGFDVLSRAKVDTEFNAVVIRIHAIVRRYLKFMDTNEPVELLTDRAAVEVDLLNAGPHIIVGVDGVVTDADACDFHGLRVLIRWH